MLEVVVAVPPFGSGFDVGAREAATFNDRLWARG